ncbi:UDP-N-acetylglucosamine pyrophosphorylase [Verrucomicrobia bacterium S94]|nr:UDP-N-acetylglucosamine pyrophosphorylase [Verrucomicrobia bacterium S94]
MHSKSDKLSQGVYIGDEVDCSRIASDAVIYPGCRIRGPETSIGPGSVLGAESPVTLDNCQLGRGVKLKGGFFSGAVFFDGANMGDGAHVRAGTILEEEAGGAHTVGLKQSIFLPFVTAGSLINFCDALMAGGTSRKDHSEIGSSYVHFNFTPHQDKATPSLIGDVPDGVFLDQKPIFLGGQGGLVGPARIAFGTVIAAGGICREDILKPEKLHIPEAPKSGIRDYRTGIYRRAQRIVTNNLCYIGNILALRAWYENVRLKCIRDEFDEAVLEGGKKNLDLILTERIRRLDDLCRKFEFSFQWLENNNGAEREISVQKRFAREWPEIKLKLQGLSSQPPDAFFQGLYIKTSYIETIQSLSPTVRESGRMWLQSIVDKTTGLWA